jgi:hypothetical protein
MLLIHGGGESVQDEDDELHIELDEAIGRVSSAAIGGLADRMMALEGI